MMASAKWRPGDFDMQDLQEVEALASELSFRVHQITPQGDEVAERLKEARAAYRQLGVAMRKLRLEGK